ncbi:MAG: thiol peroxidase [Bacteroidota bacterium]|nr:thiol peroxidase [Bacteroidota bacterium]
MEQNNVKITFAGNPMPVSGKEIKVGDKAPNFTVLDNDLKPVQLSDFDGVKILSVFPSLDTGVCASQNRKFNEEAAKHENIDILSISVDLPFAQKRFCGAEGIDKVKTLSDHKDLDFGEKYGFVMAPLRLLARGTVVIDKDNTVKHVEYVSEVTTEPNYEAALKVAAELV